MFRSTKRPESIGSRLLTSFSRAKVIVPPYVAFAAPLAVAAPAPVGAGPPLVVQAPMTTAAAASRVTTGMRKWLMKHPSRPAGLTEHTSGCEVEFTVPTYEKERPVWAAPSDRG